MALSESRLRGIFWGGLAGGIVSAIPLLAFMNCFCCLWAWAAGAIAVAVVRRTDTLPDRQAPGIGALAGAFAGLVTSSIQLVYTLFSGPSLNSMLGSIQDLVPGGIPDSSMELLQGLPESGLAVVAMHLFSALFMMGIFAGFGALGALIYQRLTRPGVSPPADVIGPDDHMKADGPTQPE